MEIDLRLVLVYLRQCWFIYFLWETLCLTFYLFVKPQQMFMVFMSVYVSYANNYFQRTTLIQYCCLGFDIVDFQLNNTVDTGYAIFCYLHQRFIISISTHPEYFDLQPINWNPPSITLRRHVPSFKLLYGSNQR